jgi:predicted transcriptional regulator
MKTADEVSVWYLVPAIRRELSLALSRKHLSQAAIARTLGLTPPAVSQYISGKRAGVVLPTGFRQLVTRAAGRIVAHTDCARFEIENLVQDAKRTGILCTVHRSHDSVPECCSVCMDGCNHECIS